ncbi:MAG: peptidoglycan-binding protein LysM [Gammaproteobacteria bacterium]|nr:peptidoglycan-binding protein LysM [Gammaproteobacteria bacterium]
MGLLDFAADFGKKLFGDDDDEAEKIKEAIEASNPGVSDLDVSYADGEVKLAGNSASAESMEKAVLIAGNVKGVSAVNIDGMQAPAPSPDVQYYTVERGDSLSKIAKSFYGNAMDYPKLFEANREVIQDPDLIYPGQKIRIPEKTW